MGPRNHSREFKLELMRQLASGEKRPAQVCREHSIAQSLLLRWRKEYAARGDAAFTAREVSATEALERQVAELERLCGQLALENAALKRGLRTLRSGRATP